MASTLEENNAKGMGVWGRVDILNRRIKRGSHS